MAKKRGKSPPIPPGETSLEDFLKRLSANRLSLQLRVPVTPINDIVRGRQAITAEPALRLARYFGTTAQFSMNLQTNRELELAADAAAEQIESQVRPRSAA